MVRRRWASANSGSLPAKNLPCSAVKIQGSTLLIAVLGGVALGNGGSEGLALLEVAHGRLRTEGRRGRRIHFIIISTILWLLLEPDTGPAAPLHSLPIKRRWLGRNLHACIITLPFTMISSSHHVTTRH